MKVRCSCHHLTSDDGSTEQMEVHCSCHCHTSFDGTRANEGALFMPSSHVTWWLHRASEGSLFMPLPHFKPCFQALFLQIHNWLHHWRGTPYLWASVCRYCIYRPYGVSTLCKVCKKLRVPELLKQHSIEKHKHRAHPPWVKQIVLSQFKRSWVIFTGVSIVSGYEKNEAWYNLSCLRGYHTYKLSAIWASVKTVSWHFSDLWRNQLLQQLEEDCRKLILGVWPLVS